MKDTLITQPTRSYSGLSRLKLFWALSRTPHGLIDMAMPALGALLYLGEFPSIRIVLLGLITVFSGYTAVYALNDIVDYKSDKEKVSIGGYGDSDDYLDGVLVRHPMAMGILSFKEGLIWTLTWAFLALLGAYLLNPVCAFIFIAACILETVYCIMLKVSPFRTLVNGVVKSCGAIAAAFAVNPNPSPLFLIALFLWIFLWEIGGQNIPADWTDIEEDMYFQAQTIPVRLGVERAGVIIMVSLVFAFFMNFVLFLISPLSFGSFYFIVIIAINLYLLLIPALVLNETKERTKAIALFNKASYYPLATFVIVLIKLISQHG